MFYLCIFIFNTLIFFALTPGILFTIPNKSSKKTVALVHALIFAIIFYFTHKLIWNTTEGFDSDTYTKEENEKQKKASLSILCMKANEANEANQANKANDANEANQANKAN